MLKKTFAGILTSLLLIPMVISTQGVKAADLKNIEAYGVDTIAGYSALLSTNKTFPLTAIEFEVTKADQSTVKIPAKTDSDGIAKLDLYDYHTRKAGTYEIKATLKDQGITSKTSTFEVYPDEISATNSSLFTEKNVVSTNATVYIQVQLKDQYSNAIAGHDVQLVSSRSSDNIEQNSLRTDQTGTATFKVSSLKTGVSIYSALDTSTNTTLNSRIQLAYIDKTSSLTDVGGNFNFIQLAMAADAGPLNKFEITDLPSSISPNQNVNFSTVAQDQTGLTVENYTGTVHFSVEGDNNNGVQLPEDYTFKAEDIGKHTFNLGLKFSLPGTYKLQVTDVNNQLIKGEKTVVVTTTGSSNNSNNTNQNTSTVNLQSPTPGTYSQNIQTMTGTSPAGSKIKVFDNDQEIGQTQAGSDGKFTFETSSLADGNHEFYVVTLDNNQQVQFTSNKVKVTVDTTPATVDEIQISPGKTVAPNNAVTIKVLSEENLNQAAIVFNSDIIQLSPSPNETGAYIGSFQSPANPGVYPIDIVLVDELNNEATYQEKDTLTVSTEQNITTEENTQQPTQQETIETSQTLENEMPSDVFGVIAYGSDKKVTLVWEAASDDSKVTNYKIYYGTDPLNLDKNVTTKDATLTWYVPNLQNGKEYFFAITAIDDQGQESLEQSELVSSIPFTLEVNKNTPDSEIKSIPKPSGEALLHNAAIEKDLPKETSDTGPEVLFLFLPALGLGSLMTKKKNKK